MRCSIAGSFAHAGADDVGAAAGAAVGAGSFCVDLLEHANAVARATMLGPIRPSLGIGRASLMKCGE
jgi:hypothetical protein